MRKKGSERARGNEVNGERSAPGLREKNTGAGKQQKALKKREM